MRTCALLCYARHKPMMTPISPLRTRLIDFSPSYWTIFCSFEIILKWELSIGVDFKVNVLCKSIASRNIQCDMNYIFKNTLIAEGSSSSSVRAVQYARELKRENEKSSG